jgi:aryl-alcohol dehydrogenase-like predicted oxidoreductase
LKLVLGTAQFGSCYGVSNTSGQITNNEAKDILEYADNAGITMLDTAIAYGESEQRLGEIGVKNWQIVSKLPGIPRSCVDVSAWIFESLTISLKRLNVEKLYGFLLHCPQDLLEKDGEQLYDTLLSLKQKGCIQKIGISIYEPAELDALCSRYQFDIVQAPFNILDSRMFDSGWLARLKKLGAEVHVRSVFLQGLLLMPKNEREHRFSRWSSTWSCFEEWLSESKLNSVQACLRYALSFPEIDKVIVGIDTLNQLKEICEAADGPSPQVPKKLCINDIDLLNPARWGSL